MISVGSRDARKGLGFGAGREMDDSELEEGEACSSQINEYDPNIDPDVALAYIDDKIQDVLGHFQKDFEGGVVSAENLGAKFGGYGSFLPSYQRSPVWSHPRTPAKSQNYGLPKSPNSLKLEGGHRNNSSCYAVSQSVGLGTASASSISLVAPKAPSANIPVKQDVSVSYNQADQYPPEQESATKRPIKFHLYRIINLTKNLPKIHHQIRKISSQIPDSKKHLVPSSGTYPKGFKATGTHCGIKKNGLKDLALIISEKPCTSSAVFTTNVFKAAPVLVSREILEKKKGQNIYSLVINAGVANAVTGTKGLENAKSMGDTVSKLNGVEESSLVMSTGVIGQHLPIEKIISGINQAYNLAKQQTSEELHEGWMKAAESIMTTDTFPKLRSKQFILPSSGLKYNMAGTTKGAGMIHPNMATLLATVVTDVSISPKALNEALKYAVDRSFNSISIDNDMSTNDTFAVFANGAATTDGKVTIDDINGKDFKQFRDDLTEFAADLAKLVVRDGEGATKFVTIHVKGAKTYTDAKQIASTISTSSLVKTALYGQDANWGRILCAVGYAGVSSIIPNKVSVSFIPTDGTTPLRLLNLGEPENVNEERASEILAMEDLEINVDLGIGNEEAKMWTCDYSHEYITINGHYRT